MAAKPSDSAGPGASTEVTGGPGPETFKGCIIVWPVFCQGVTSGHPCPSLHNYQALICTKHGPGWTSKNSCNGTLEG